MVSVLGSWELAWNSPIKEAELWTFVMREFEVSDWYMWPVTGIRHNDYNTISLTESNNFEDLLELNNNKTLVYVDEKGETDLREFQHPENACYVFGSSGHRIMARYKKPEDLSIVVPTIQGKGVLWPHQCLLTVFYDRLMKGGWQ